jgi:hypothetical protein
MIAPAAQMTGISTAATIPLNVPPGPRLMS